ncbi:aminoglycoside phosphotransferase family protein [Nonomuraea monospora]|uniref:aminoglycoside phosphotransferase family protein n=1 Tax=Nonomuraea monospora TaxID=568818 RepID=UPI0031D9A790
MDGTGARLLHLRANAVYHVPGPNLVLRLRHAPGNTAVLERSRAAVEVTAWLADHDYPTIRPAALDQPAVIDGWIVTAWHHVTSTTQVQPHPHHLARLLLQLHQTKTPVTVPSIQPLGTLRADLDIEEDQRSATGVLNPVQRAWLLERCAHLEDAYARLDPPLGYGLIHGDAHTGNLFPDQKRWVLGDWDSIAYGPHLQDFIPTMMGHRRFGRPRDRWTTFCGAYGIDPELERHRAARILRAARELRSLAAYIRSADQPEIQAELQRRVTSLIDRTSTVWRPI